MFFSIPFTGKDALPLKVNENGPTKERRTMVPAETSIMASSITGMYAHAGIGAGIAKTRRHVPLRISGKSGKRMKMVFWIF
jgi:hypothetical protein